MAKKIGKGKALEELVKGSLDYTMESIRRAFYSFFPYDDAHDYSIYEIFSDHVIVRDWRSSDLKTDEYWMVVYSQSGDVYTFAARDAWVIVELTYQPQTPISSQLSAVSESKKRKGRRLEESVLQSIELVESADVNESGPWLIKGIGITADVVNANGRRYPALVLEAAVRKLKSHLHESAGQGRLLLENGSLTTGESDHPKDKGNRRPLLLDTVVNWDNVTFDGTHVMLEGKLLGTSKGKDIRAIMAGGVKPGISQRAFGDSRIVTENRTKIEEVTDLEITGFDLTAPNEESDPEAEVTFHESKNKTGEFDMNLLEQLLKLRETNPELFTGLNESQLKAMGEQQLKALEESLRMKLGVGAGADLGKALDESVNKAKQFDEMQRKAGVDAAITEATKELPFGKELNEAFVEAIKEANLKDADAVKAFVEAKRKEYGKLAAKGALKGMGFDEKKGTIHMIGDVLEIETGTPSYGRAAFEFTESLRKQEMRPAVDLRKREDRASQFALQVLARFDEKYQHELAREARFFDEATVSTDFNLPYSASRAVIAEAFPTLVALNVFDTGLMTNQIERVYYESFSGETGYTVAVTDEVETAGVEGTWYDLANKNITPGTVVVTSNPAGTTYVEGTDFVIDYELGKIMPIAAGAIDANDVLVDYSYNAIRKGENAEIERAKTTLSYQTIEASAIRLADYLTDEAIKYSRSQLGWDAATRMISNIIRQMQLDTDKSLIEKAMAAALSVAGNSGGTWDISDANYGDLVAKLGAAMVKVANRFYQPTSILCSVTNAERLSNWDGLKKDGFPNALLSAAGFQNMVVKGLPVFGTTQMRDNWFLVLNRQVVMHRIYSPMTVKGPYPIYSNGKLIAGEQYYAEEYNASIAPIGGKAAFVATQA